MPWLSLLGAQRELFDGIVVAESEESTLRGEAIHAHETWFRSPTDEKRGEYGVALKRWAEAAHNQGALEWAEKLIAGEAGR